ncbi:IS110 family transposase [Clostridium sp. AM25-23AC]|uniref:IS110 family transposase n=1 Tax=Clostridium sp. AM25-23AC TaxID=2305240 RepID=UPI000E42B84C|nr:IS110 family transposase [Clostridium sp. AM25-23AC]RGD88774.1 IS110 family transposase [Clostridium sp. AM25-23AC]RJW83620.1 IS110 family transposase [Clostridiales bacterium AF36-10]
MSFKIIKNNCCGLDVHKTWIFACIGITDSNNRTEYKQARFSSFTKGLNQLCDWLAKYNCKDVCMESTGKYWIPVFNILEHHNLWVTLSHPKYTKPMKGNKTDRKDAKWICDLYMCGMVKPSFIPTADIRELRDLVRYRYKLTCMITGEKNRAQNCLTVSNLKLDEVFSDVFGKSSRSITEQILQHPGEAFDVAHFVHGRCKTPIEEIQAAVDGAISKEQEILRLSDKYETALNLIRTVPGFDKNPLTAIQVLSEIGGDMSVFPTAKHLVSWAGCCPRNDQSNQKIKSTRISRAGSYFKPILVQVANALIKSKKHPEFTTRYKRIKARRGHKKAIIAICRMILTAIWHILSDLEPYTPEGFLESRPVKEEKVLSTSQALNLLKQRGYIIKDEPLAVS